jgi:hypothetical protein
MDPSEARTAAAFQTDSGGEKARTKLGRASSNTGLRDASIGYEQAKTVSGPLALGTTGRVLHFSKLKSQSLRGSGMCMGEGHN